MVNGMDTITTLQTLSDSYEVDVTWISRGRTRPDGLTSISRTRITWMMTAG